MKLKYLYLGLLSTLVMAGQTEAMMKRTYETPQIQQKLKEHEDLQAKIEPMLDLATHGGDQEAAAQDIVDNLGKHPTKANRTGKTVNHKIADLNTRIGTKTAGPTGPSAHEKITDLMAIQGAITNQATARGANSGVVGANANDLVGTAIGREEAILARLKAGLALTNNNAGQQELRTITATKTANTGGGGPLAAADIGNIAACATIEDVLAELGW